MKVKGIRNVCKQISAGKPGRVFYDRRRDRVVYKKDNPDARNFSTVWVDMTMTMDEIERDLTFQSNRFWASWERG